MDRAAGTFSPWGPWPSQRGQSCSSARACEHLAGNTTAGATWPHLGDTVYEVVVNAKHLADPEARVHAAFQERYAAAGVRANKVPPVRALHLPQFLEREITYRQLIGISFRFDHPDGCRRERTYRQRLVGLEGNQRPLKVGLGDNRRRVGRCERVPGGQHGGVVAQAGQEHVHPSRRHGFHGARRFVVPRQKVDRAPVRLAVCVAPSQTRSRAC